MHGNGQKNHILPLQRLEVIIMSLSKDVKTALEEIIGLSLEEVSKLDFDEEKNYVETKTKKALRFSKKVDPRITGRGNPLIIRRRITTMEDIDKRIMELK